MSELKEFPLKMSMSSEPLVYLTYGDMDSLVFKTQVSGICAFIQSECNIPVLPILLQSEPSPANLEKARILGTKTHVITVHEGWWNEPETIESLRSQVMAYSPGSIMCDDPRLLPLCSSVQSQEIPFFFYAIGCRYMSWNEPHAYKTSWINEMQQLEARAFKTADWIYATSDELVTHFKQTAAYRDHNHSFLPMRPLQVGRGSAGELPPSFLAGDTTVFTYAGPIVIDELPRSLLEAFAAILKIPKARLLILSEDIEALSAYPFLQHANCLMKKASFEASLRYVAISDYGIILSKKSARFTYRGSVEASTFLSNGAKLIVSPGLGSLSAMTPAKGLGIIYRGRTNNDLLRSLTPRTEAERSATKFQAYTAFDWNSNLIRIRFRHLKRLHEGA